MMLLDTNIVIEFWKQNSLVVGHVATLAQTGLYVSDVCVYELLVGARDGQDMRFIQSNLKNLLALPINESISQNETLLLALFSLSHRLSLPDALIAATALHHGLPLYTLNRKDFRYIPDLQLYEPA